MSVKHKQVQSRIGKKALTYTVRELKTIAFESFEWGVVGWSKRAGISNPTLYNLLSGRTRFPRYETIVKLAHAVHVDLVPMEAGSIELRAQGAPEIKTLVKSK